MGTAMATGSSKSGNVTVSASAMAGVGAGLGYFPEFLGTVARAAPPAPLAWPHPPLAMRRQTQMRAMAAAALEPFPAEPAAALPLAAKQPRAGRETCHLPQARSEAGAGPASGDLMPHQAGQVGTQEPTATRRPKAQAACHPPQARSEAGADHLKRECRRGRQCSREQRRDIQWLRWCEFDSDRLRRLGGEQFWRLWGWTRGVWGRGQRN